VLATFRFISVLQFISSKNATQAKYKVFFIPQDPAVRARRTPNNAVGTLIHMDSFIIDALWVTDAFLYDMKLPRLKRFNFYENEAVS
jgi:hypothetical protein